jgi:hypothetical protein
MTTLLPARINFQIRDGVQNELLRFQVEVDASRPNKETGHTDHDVELHSIVIALATALRDQIRDLREKTAEPAEVEVWLAEMRDWTFETRRA